MRPGAGILVCEYSHRSNSFYLQGYAFTARTFVHIAVRFDELAEREHRGFQRYQYLVSRQLVDVTQGSLQRHLVLDDAQFRFAGEVADAVHKELNILLERRASREWRLVATLQAIQHQAATRRQYITQQRHLRATQAVEHHVYAAVVGELVDLHQQVLFFGDD